MNFLRIVARFFRLAKLTITITTTTTKKELNTRAAMNNGGAWEGLYFAKSSNKGGVYPQG